MDNYHNKTDFKGTKGSINLVPKLAAVYHIELGKMRLVNILSLMMLIQLVVEEVSSVAMLILTSGSRGFI